MENGFSNIEEVLRDSEFVDWASSIGRIKHTPVPEALLDRYPEELILEALEYTQDCFSVPNMDVARINAIKQNVDAAIEQESQAPALRRLLPIAASFLLFALLGLGFFISSEKVYESGYGELAQVVLPDGSQVTLNANSSIRFQRNWFLGKERVVFMDGEAFFDVSPEPSVGASKFKVLSKNGVVTVLGTRFNLKDRSDQYQLSLEEGKVQYDSSSAQAANSDSRFLSPGETLQFDKHGAVEIVSNYPHQFSAWTKGDLYLNDTSLEELRLLIEEHYGIEIQVNDPLLKEKRLSGLLKNSDLNTLLRAIEKSLQVKVLKESGKIYVSE